MAEDIGHGVDLQRSNDGTSGGTFATVGTIYDLTPPNPTRATVETTSHSSTDRWQEYVSGLRDGGEMTADIAFDAATGTAVYSFFADLNADTAGYYKLVHNDSGGREWGFAAWVTEITPTTPIDDKQMFTVSFKLTGKPTFITLT